MMNIKGLQQNNPIKLQKFQMLESLRILNSNSIINYMGIYSKDDKRKVMKMIDDNLRKSNDIGILLFYDR